ncbi:MAG TPA: ROK family protein [Mycobacteriales bacterium]|jgi:kanosamine 6-kinase|nr:ROK family protein [Mycobacteriales bacterium]
MSDRSGASAVCIEVGASGVETVHLGPGSSYLVEAGAHEPAHGVPLLIAVPGLVAGGRVVAASNLDWYDVDPAARLGLRGRARVVCNDAEAAALGESVLRPGAPELVFLGLGTGVGGAVVLGLPEDRVVHANLFAHHAGFSTRTCRCTRVGCLETVAGGWALPETLDDDHLEAMASALAEAVRMEPLATPELVVVAGGLSRAYPQLVALLATALPDRVVEGSAAPGTKSAAPWGLRDLFDRESVRLSRTANA